jgi:intracellular sulfur oxidation DsrE/DsrF family protein
MRNVRFPQLFALLLSAASLFTASATAESMEGAEHRVVIQVSTDDARTQTIAMNNAVNLQKDYGMDNVEVEIVAYGPGLSMLIGGSKQSLRVQSLAKQDIVFSACGNTMKRIEQKDGKPVVLSQGVQVVPAGVSRIVELQQQGYSYIRP